jgi:hypothetical protein
MSIPPSKTGYPALDVPPGLEAAYANIVRITHSPSEMILDFARLLPGQNGAPVVARLLMSPVAVKMLYHALGENLARYEASYGPIPSPGSGALARDLFRGLQSPDAPGENSNPPDNSQES